MKTRSGSLLLAAVAGALSLATPVLAFTVDRYHVDAPAGTVDDTETGLTWQLSVSPARYTWVAALGYCEGLSLGGHSDWRLPSQKELHTIVDVRRYNPAIDGAAFPQTPSEFFWSSTPYMADASTAWLVDFTSGDAYDDRATTNYYRVRCVRGG